jgi:uncharacterized protein YeaO (DUF488 family)
LGYARLRLANATNYEFTAMFKIKRVYEPPAPDDGYRVLVDRLWPRGLTRKDAAIDAWLKELAPSTELRRWFGGEDASWREFARRYRKELAAPELAASLADLRARARRGAVTLLYAKRDVQENNAVVLRDHLEA